MIPTLLLTLILIGDGVSTMMPVQSVPDDTTVTAPMPADTVSATVQSIPPPTDPAAAEGKAMGLLP